MKSNPACAALIMLLLFSVQLSGQVKLPRLISDGMVLQREIPVKIWGWSAPNEQVTVRFMDSTYQASGGEDGKWKIQLSEMKAGGPYTMSITASNRIEIRDILVGDVWLCSGQSNMEFPMRRVSWVYPEEFTGSGNDRIRQFNVPMSYDFIRPHEDLPGGSWKSATPENIPDFSATGYFFAKELYAKYGVPVGLINASLGGSPAQAWMSEEALKAFPEHYREMQEYKNTELVARINRLNRTRARDWYNELNKKDLGCKEKPGFRYSSSQMISSWKTLSVPRYWYGTELGNTNGAFWFGRTFEIPAATAGKPALLVLGRIIDADSVFINGRFVGATSYQYPPRRYPIPPGLLKKGENTIVVRVISNRGTGGFVPDKPYHIIRGTDTIGLAGTWHYRIGALMEPMAPEINIRWKPGGLFNAMLAPLMNYRIKGAAWYQGEANTGRALEYRELLPALIRDWRAGWNQGKFPFVYVQLPNFMEPRDVPSMSNWALMRESQLMTLSVPNTAMAVAIDLGEWNDIHPLNKMEVGHRLFLAAQKVAYGDDKTVTSGPLYDSMRIEGNRIVISFTSVGGGLAVRGGGELKEFAIAGEDRRFAWAEAVIEDDKVVVWNESITHPVAVRYAWADNPVQANLLNLEGLPASPFRTDDWVPGED